MPRETALLAFAYAAELLQICDKPLIVSCTTIVHRYTNKRVIFGNMTFRKYVESNVKG